MRQPAVPWPRTVIFDLDGTLVDSFPGIQLGLNRALAELGGSSRELDWVRRHVGRGARRLSAAAAGREIDPEALLERFRHHYSDVLTDHTPPYEGVTETLRDMACRHALAIASNKPLHWVERLVDHLGWSAFMAAVVGPESAGAHKPDPAMIEVVLKKVDGRSGDALLVGDMPVDAATGANAGLPVVGVATGSTPREELLELGCVAVLDGVQQLPGWIASR